MLYLDSIRDINEIGRNFIEEWVSMLGFNSFKNIFKHEMLFSSNGKMYWLYVQEPTISYYKQELKIYDSVYIYSSYAGSIKIKDDLSYIFTANDFQKIEIKRVKKENCKGVSFKLPNRNPLYLSIPCYKSNSEGIVVVEISVDDNGNVIHASTDSIGSTIKDENIFQIVKTAALKSKFNSKPNSRIQKGSITYCIETE